MVFYNESDKSTILAIPMSEVLERYGVQRGKKGNYHCPFGTHSDKTPSLSINNKNGNNYCHCFACGESANPISFVQKTQNVGFLEACNILDRDFNLHLHDGNLFNQETKIDNTAFPLSPKDLEKIGIKWRVTSHEIPITEEALLDYSTDLKETGEILKERLKIGLPPVRPLKEIACDVYNSHTVPRSYTILEEYNDDKVGIITMLQDKIKYCYENIDLDDPIADFNYKEDLTTMYKKLDKVMSLINTELYVESKFEEDIDLDERA